MKEIIIMRYIIGCFICKNVLHVYITLFIYITAYVKRDWVLRMRAEMHAILHKVSHDDLTR